EVSCGCSGLLGLGGRIFEGSDQSNERLEFTQCSLLEAQPSLVLWETAHFVGDLLELTVKYCQLRRVQHGVQKELDEIAVLLEAGDRRGPCLVVVHFALVTEQRAIEAKLVEVFDPVPLHVRSRDLELRANPRLLELLELLLESPEWQSAAHCLAVNGDIMFERQMVDPDHFDRTAHGIPDLLKIFWSRISRPSTISPLRDKPR